MGLLIVPRRRRQIPRRPGRRRGPPRRRVQIARRQGRDTGTPGARGSCAAGANGCPALAPTSCARPTRPLQTGRRSYVRSVLHTVNFTTVTEAGTFGDAAEFHITFSSEKENGWSLARFFPMYQVLDEQTAPADAAPLTLDERHRAAAYAAAAGAVELDAIVTDMPTAGRTDVGDNVTVIAVTPEDAVALIGHYLRVTSNPIVGVESGQLLGGGAWTTTESTGTVVNSYLWGVVSAMPYFDAAIIVTRLQQDSALT